MTPEDRLPKRYLAAGDRYQRIDYRRCGRSGLKLPALSLGLWHNFGDYDCYHRARGILLAAFDEGVTHFDLANNYGPPYGSAEENFGKAMRHDLAPYRDELILSTKAGYDMWPGPYGDWGSRKYLTASLDQSLRRMNVDYVDIFYHHRPDPETPLEETMGALASAVQQGKALYAGLSNYPADRTQQAARLLREMGCPLLIHQPRYSMLDRWVEDDLLDTLADEGVGCIPFSPLAQGLLTDKYLGGVPAGSRAAKEHGYLQKDTLTMETLAKIEKLSDIAFQRGQTLAQMALAWLLKDDRVTTVLVGASSVEQLKQNLACRKVASFSDGELQTIETILAGNAS
ncbi:L-glyceraldehyde 3-phosphate reductase [Planctomycetes bacterium MalM25]|nr:L-glyceraldehyde 3-phosphate reductase [Planctomycetes bacterium MalM25]